MNNERESLPTKKGAFSFGESAEVVLAAFFAEIFLQIIITLFIRNEAAYTWVVVVLNQVVFFGTSLFFCKTKNVSFLKMTGFNRPLKPGLLCLLIPIALLAVASFAPLAALVSTLLEKAGYSYSPDYHIDFSNPAIFTVSLLALAVLPAIGEETLIRGALMGGAKERSPLFAVFYSALVFALFHGNAVQLVHQFLLGLLIGYLSLVTRTLWAGAIVHFLNNASAMLLDHGYLNGWINEKFYNYFSAPFSSDVPVYSSVLTVALCWAFLLGLLVLLTRLLVRRREAEGARLGNAAGGPATRANAFLSFLAPSEGENGKAKPIEVLHAVPHAVLVAALALVLLAGILTEVL